MATFTAGKHELTIDLTSDWLLIEPSDFRDLPKEADDVPLVALMEGVHQLQSAGDEPVAIASMMVPLLNQEEELDGVLMVSLPVKPAGPID